MSLVLGRPVADLFRHNAANGIIGDFSTDEQIEQACKNVSIT